MDPNETHITRAASGDALAIDDLLAGHLPQLRAFVRLRMGPELRAKESASDLVQSACRELLSNLSRYRHRGSDEFRRWLFTTALRKVRNKAEYYQARKREVAREARHPDASEVGSIVGVYERVVTPSADLMAREQMERLETAFDRLSEDHREVITLAKVCGLPHREIATAMGRNEAACRQLLSRALAELAVLLERL